MTESICQLRASQVHGQNNLIVIDEPDDVLDLNLVPVLALVEHQLVPINELTKNVGDSEEGESSDEEVEVWEMPYKEFEENVVGSWHLSPEV